MNKRPILKIAPLWLLEVEHREISGLEEYPDIFKDVQSRSLGGRVNNLVSFYSELFGKRRKVCATSLQVGRITVGCRHTCNDKSSQRNCSPRPGQQLKTIVAGKEEQIRKRKGRTAKRDVWWAEGRLPAPPGSTATSLNRAKRKGIKDR